MLAPKRDDNLFDGDWNFFSAAYYSAVYKCTNTELVETSAAASQAQEARSTKFLLDKVTHLSTHELSGIH